jgi:hypothetical protein
LQEKFELTWEEKEYLNRKLIELNIENEKLKSFILTEGLQCPDFSKQNYMNFNDD